MVSFRVIFRKPDLNILKILRVGLCKCHSITVGVLHVCLQIPRHCITAGCPFDHDNLSSFLA